MEEVKKIIDIQFNGKESIADVKKEISQLKKELDECAVGSKAAQDKSLELAKAQEKLKAAMKGAITDTGKLDNSYNGLVTRMKMLKDAQKQVDLSTKAGRKQFADYSKEINKINDQLKSLDASNGVFGRNVGNYANSIKEAFSGMGGAVTGVFNSINAGLKAICTNPWVAILTAILLALKQLADAFKRNSDAMVKINKIGNNFKAILTAIQRAFDRLVVTIMDGSKKSSEALGKVKETIKNVYDTIKPVVDGVVKFYKYILNAQLKFIQAYLKGLDKAIELAIKGAARLAHPIDDKEFEETKNKYLEKWNNLTSGVKTFVNNAIETVKQFGSDLWDSFKKDATESKAILDQITDLEDALEKKRTQHATANAQDEEKIAKLQAEIADRETFTAEERLKKAEEIQNVRKQILARERDELQMELKIMQLNHSLTQSSDADLLEEANKKAEIIKINGQIAAAEREYFQTRRTIQKELKKDANQDEKERKEGIQAEIQAVEREKALLNERLGLVQKYSQERYDIQDEILDKEEELARLKAEKDISGETQLQETLLQIEKEYALKRQKAANDRIKEQSDYKQIERTNEVQKTQIEYGSNSLEFYQAELDAAKAFYDSLFQLQGESDAEYEARQLKALKDLKDKEAKLNQARISNYTALANGLTSIMSTVASAWGDSVQAQVNAGKISQEEGEKQFENVKALEIAIATIQMITGIVTALSGTWTTKTGIWDIAIAATQAASIAAAGIANIVKIKQTTLGSNASASASAGAASFQLPSLETYQPNYTQNLTGANDVDNLSKSIKESMEDLEIKAYVVESEITSAQKRATTRRNESTW